MVEGGGAGHGAPAPQVQPTEAQPQEGRRKRRRVHWSDGELVQEGGGGGEQGDKTRRVGIARKRQEQQMKEEGTFKLARLMELEGMAEKEVGRCPATVCLCSCQ